MSRTLAQRAQDEANQRIAHRCIEENHEELQRQNAALLEALKHIELHANRDRAELAWDGFDLRGSLEAIADHAAATIALAEGETA